MKKGNDIASGAETPEQPSDGNRKVQPLVRRNSNPLGVLLTDKTEIVVSEFVENVVCFSVSKNKEEFWFELNRDEAGELCNVILEYLGIDLPKPLLLANS